MESTNGSYRTVSILARWYADGAMARVLAAIRERLPGMASRADEDRGPEDYERDDREVMRILRQLIARPSGNSYHEGGNGEKRLLTWILGVLALLLVGAVGGGIGMYGKLTAIERGLNDHDDRIDRLERFNERRYRGADAAP